MVIILFMNSVIDSLSSKMLNNKNMSEFTRNIDVSHLKNKVNKKTTNTNKVCLNKNKFFIPFQNDKLFWIYYYIKNGYVEYNMIGSIFYETEIDNKLKIIDEIKKNKCLLKEKKIKNIKDSENELLCNKEINFKTFIIICIIYRINILYLKDNMYYKLINEDNNELYIIRLLNNTYSCEKSSMINLEHYEKNRYEVLNYDKPILCKGGYKIEELIELCKKLNVEINDNKKQKKDDLYMLIKEKTSLLYKIEK